jgi:hypothetical protein
MLVRLYLYAGECTNVHVLPSLSQFRQNYKWQNFATPPPPPPLNEVNYLIKVIAKLSLYAGILMAGFCYID